MCKCCRFRKFGLARRKYNWTPELVRALRAAYAHPGRAKRAAALSDLQRLVKWPRHVLTQKATELGITYTAAQPWSAAEVEYLQEHLGEMPLSVIAKRLRRSRESVHAKVARMQCSARLTEGYAQADLVEMLGVSQQKVQRWIRNGWLRVQYGRVDGADLVKFLRRHADEYDLRDVKQWWFKAVMFA